MSPYAIRCVLKCVCKCCMSYFKTLGCGMSAVAGQHLSLPCDLHHISGHTDFLKLSGSNASSQFDHLALQEVQVLASILQQNPCLPGERFTNAYNKAAARQELPQRSEHSLCSMLRRYLPLIRCSRALGLTSAASMDHLHEVLQAVATNDAGLSVLAEHAKEVQRLCKSAEISIFEALRVLPKAVGSKEWVEVLDQQCEIEDAVRFWQRGCRQKFQQHATMEQARQDVCRRIFILLVKCGFQINRPTQFRLP